MEVSVGRSIEISISSLLFFSFTDAVDQAQLIRFEPDCLSKILTKGI